MRQNLGATVDHVFVQNGTTIWNASVAFNRFTEGNRRNAVQTSFSPAPVGFPAYMDERARAIGGDTHLPRIDFSDNSYSDFGVDRGGFTDYSVITARGELAKILSTHSVKSGVDVRQHRRENIAGGNTSGVDDAPQRLRPPARQHQQRGTARARMGGVHARRDRHHDGQQHEPARHQPVLRGRTCRTTGACPTASR